MNNPNVVVGARHPRPKLQEKRKTADGQRMTVGHRPF